MLNCYSKGTLSAKTNNSGGIDGRFSYREKCYSISKLVYPNYSKPIGNDGTTSEDCFWAPDTSGSDINSTGKSTVEDMKKQETYTNVGWDFEKIWIMDTKTGYPRLQWENNIIH